MVAVVAIIGGMGTANAADMTLEQLQAQIAQLEQQLAQYQSQLNTLQGGETTGTTEATGGATAIEGCTITSFDRNLKVGMTGDDVKCLQIVLNSDSDTRLAESGAGSPGNETSYFGPITKAAVVKFQEKYADDVLASYGLTSGTGFVGKTTRAKLNELLTATGNETGGETGGTTGGETGGTTGGETSGTTGETTTPGAETYTSEADCTAAGYYWYNDTCNATAQEEEVAAGALSVSLADDTPAAQNIPAGVPIEFLKVKLTAGAADVNINSIKLTASGLGDPTYIKDVTLYDGNTKVGTSKNINSEREANFNFSTPIAVTANTSKTITVKAKIQSSQTGYFALGIASAADILSDGTVEGSFPITSNTMAAVSGVTVGTLTLDAEDNDTTAQVGADGVDLVDFTATADSVEDINFSGLTLKNYGTLRAGELGTVSLLHNDKVIAEAQMDSDRYITFSFDPILIQKDETENFSVKADIEGGNSGDTILLYPKTDSDIVAIGTGYGYQTQISRSAWDTDDGDSTEITLTGGQLQINMNKSAVPSANVLPNTKNVVVGQLEMTASSENIKVTGLTLTLHFSGTGFDREDVENVELRDTSTGAITDLSNVSGTDTYNTDEEIELTKGVKKVYEVRLDTKSTAPDGGVVYVSLESGNIEAEGVTSEATINNIVPSSVTGASITVTASGLTHSVITLNNAYPIAGSSDVSVYKASLKASKSSDVTLRSVKFADNSSGPNTSFSDDDISKATLVIDGNNVKSLSGQISESSSGANTLTFSGLNYTIAAGQTATLYLKLDLNSTLSVTTPFAVHISEILAKDKDSRNVDVTEDTTAGPTVTPAASGEMDILLSTTSAGANKDRYVLAGTGSDFMGVLKFEAIKENVKVKDFYLIDETDSDTAATNVVNSLSKVQLYAADKTTLIGESSDFTVGDIDGQADGNDVLISFTGLDHVVPVGTEQVYVKAVTNGIGPASEQTGTSGTDFTFKIFSNDTYPIVLEGQSSNVSIDISGVASPTYGNGDSEFDNDATTKTATLTGVKIVSLENAMENTALTGGDQVIYKIRVTVDSGTNLDGTASPLKAVLKKLRLKLSTDLAAEPTDITIKRVGGTADPVSLTIIGDGPGGYLQTASDGYIDMTDLSTDDQIATGYAEFEVRATAADTTDKYLQVKLVNTEDTNAFVWNDGTTDFTGVKLDSSEVLGNSLQ